MTSAARSEMADIGSRLCLNRDECAFYVHVAVPTWNRMVKAGQMPQPVQIGTRYLWDRREVEMAIANMPRGISQDADADAGDGW